METARATLNRYLLVDQRMNLPLEDTFEDNGLTVFESLNRFISIRWKKLKNRLLKIFKKLCFIAFNEILPCFTFEKLCIQVDVLKKPSKE